MSIPAQGAVGAETMTVPCGGCGAKSDAERCIGCLHDFGDAASTWTRKATPAPRTDGGMSTGEDAVEAMRARKDAAYEERNKVVAALARLFPSGLKKTDIPGWDAEWHGAVYIDLPTGQVSWHFHDSQAHLFDGLPPYAGEWDGHDTPEKYARLAALAATPAQSAGVVPDSLRALSEAVSRAAYVRICRDQSKEDWREAGAAFDRREQDGGCYVHALELALAIGADAAEVLASHPAGQSAGSGAEDAGLKDAIAEIVRRAEKDQTFLRRTLARMRAEQEPAPDSTRTGPVEVEDWRDDPSADERWCAGVDYAQKQLCDVLGIDPDAVCWDAATETLDGDIQAVICTILAAWGGDDWQALAARPAAPEAQGAWRPISTAPKDGTKLLLCVAGYEPCIGGWFEKRWLSFDPESFDHETLTMWLEDTTYEPTHWRPLPAPPYSDQEG